MNVTAQDFLWASLNAAWRRRYLLALPVVIFAALSGVAAKYWPRIYTSSMLIMLQEKANVDPLKVTGTTIRDVRLRADEIEVLLKSEMGRAVQDLRQGREPLSGTDLVKAIEDLRSALTVRVVGGEFIELELRDFKSEGLGNKLSIVAARFLESLLSKEAANKTARHFAMEQRKKAVDQARAALDDWILTRGRTTSVDPTVATLKARLSIEQRAIEDLASDSLNLVAADIAQVRRAVGDHNKSVMQLGPVQKSDRIKELEARLVAHDKLAGEIAAQLTIAANRPPTDGAYEAGKKVLESRLADQMAQFEMHNRRSPTSIGGSSAPLGLLAPEQIRILSEPQDPSTPTSSAVKIVLLCIATGLALGLGLVVVAETIDDRIYDAKLLATAIEFPVLAELPNDPATAARLGASHSSASQAGDYSAQLIPLAVAKSNRGGQGSKE